MFIYTVSSWCELDHFGLFACVWGGWDGVQRY